MPCRGTGRLTSGLGGQPHEVQCPWCQGSGRRMAGFDAQQAPAEVASPPSPPADMTDAPPADTTDAPPADTTDAPLAATTDPPAAPES
jgi:hypothetical protein